MSKKSLIDFFPCRDDELDEVDGFCGGDSLRIVRLIGGGCSKIKRLIALDLTSPLGETIAS